MKRFIPLFIALVLISPSAFGWALREHASVAQLAENHLTPKAKELLKDYLGGNPMVYYASHADFFRSETVVDIGFEPTQGSRIIEFPHGYRVDKNFKPYRTIENEDGSIFKHSLYHMDRVAKNLAENHATMNDSVRLMQLYILIHGIGDMHCPVHIEYDGHAAYAKIPIYLRSGKKDIKRSLHGAWEARMIGGYNPWTYSDIVQILDIYTDKQREEFCQGDIYTWGEDVARSSCAILEHQPYDVLTNGELYKKYQDMAEELLAKAGYRLAKLLNEILK